jgi:hypothetical protein
MLSSFKNDYSWFDLVLLEKKGYSITLDSTPIKLSCTYLNKDNISEIEKDRKRKIINIIRKNKNSTFFSIEDLRDKNNYPKELQHMTVDGKALDSIEISETKFENESVKYLRLLTLKDYEGKEFDDLPQVKQSVGKGILIINTE